MEEKVEKSSPPVFHYAWRSSPVRMKEPDATGGDFVRIGIVQGFAAYSLRSMDEPDRADQPNKQTGAAADNLGEGSVPFRPFLSSRSLMCDAYSQNHCGMRQRLDVLFRSVPGFSGLVELSFYCV